MTYNYNRLWKLLIDKGMTKTQMRLQAGISTNILAKKGKGEPVAMESLAKIATAARATYNFKRLSHHAAGVFLYRLPCIWCQNQIQGC